LTQIKATVGIQQYYIGLGRVCRAMTLMTENILGVRYVHDYMDYPPVIQALMVKLLSQSLGNAS